MSNITFALFPIPIVTPKGSGYIVYVKCNAMWENDEVCVAMDDGGQYFHFNTGQLQAFKNATYGINAAPKESYTEEWHRKFNEGIQIPPHGWQDTREKKEWDDLLVAEFAGYLTQCIKQGATAVEVPGYLTQFKEKHNIK